jgi:hypothetical protein
MKVDFENILSHTTRLDDFELKWRFIDEKYDKLPANHLELLQPLDKVGAKFLSEYISAVNLHGDVPFKEGFFRTIDKARILEGNQREIKKWLYQRGIPFAELVFLSWSQENAMVVPWKIFVKYFDSFYYSISDDLTVINKTLAWALLFYHEDEIYFGTNKDFKPSEAFADIDFIW